MTTTARPLLEARSLSIGHGRRALGAPLDLDLRAGEILCLLGPNGCGKTTLFRTLLGLLPALGGQVMLDGNPLDTTHRAARARLVGYVPQAAPMMFAYRVLDLVAMGRAAHLGLLSTPTRGDLTIAHACLEQLGIAALATRTVTTLSGGERQLVLVARALAQQPRLLVMDEPTASLDFGNQLRILDVAKALAHTGISILVSTHQPQHALQIADRIALMAAGSLQAVGPAAQVASASQLAALYGVDVARITAALPASCLESR